MTDLGSIKTVRFDGAPLTATEVEALARREALAVLSGEIEFRQRIDAGAAFLEQVWREDGVIYGVTTGYGDSCSVNVPQELVHSLPRHLYTFHGCGMGAPFSLEETRAILAARLASLCQGYSGVRYVLLERICLLLQRDLLPVIPSEGSVGASGDLTPLSYLAAVIEGHRELWYKGERRAAAEVFELEGLEPLVLQPKEALALMNGTAAMTGLACLAVCRARYLAQLAARITSLCSVALEGNHFHFDPVLFSVKPHPGQQAVAGWIHDDLKEEEVPRNSSRLQDRYSLRCAPHVIGVLQDSLGYVTDFVENELNSANDNPIIDAEGAHILHGGHFYGGHIAHAMDGLKSAVANLADLVDRQIAQAVDPKFNHGLPANLSGATGAAASVNHGFKAVQIAVSAWTAEALKGTMPASVFSRSTECHNQDKVSMGTIAARDCQRVLELVEQVLAAGMLVGWQGVQLRLRDSELAERDLRPSLRKCLEQTGMRFEFLQEDRPLEADLHRAVACIHERYWTLYD
ncbi:HAL/PAL/TAL family ammonia-lyase [Pseudohalioglobus lutimaris]|uniref:tyrosine ammonia-lyase n=1 Tax=Pseudohalioglobus lutimaris TaxID=1737061 RepID=A0A2N5WZL8_9GAMM|nr:aromatic amino acid ammonia-lyase [Pseudohalioglobus lutimaris]PLW67658.1 aromatic amino acid lyase [Pseudohalioglobus lutimaris]